MRNHLILSDINGSLTAVKMVIYVHDGVEYTENPQAIYFEFSNKSSVTIRCASDGESLAIVEGMRDFFSIDMGEFGNEIVKDFTIQPPWNRLHGVNISSISELISLENNIGILLDFRYISIYIVNLGDELFIFDQFPSKQLANENVKIMRIF